MRMTVSVRSVPTVAAMLLFAATISSQSSEAASPASEQTLGSTGAPAPPTPRRSDDPVYTTSRVLSKKDVVKRNGEPVCDIRFVYAGMVPEGLFWDEPCDIVTAEMKTRADLEALDDWERLDSFDKAFVNAMPEGKVLYIAGEFSAAVYPLDVTGTFYEVWMSD